MIERIVITLSILAAAAIAGMTWMQFSDNPMDLRRQTLVNDLAMATPESVEYVTNADVSYEALIADAVNKRSLWRELIPPPPPPKKAPKKVIPPDFVRMLNGVVPSLREHIGLRVKIKTPKNPRGAYFQVGDIINKCVILRISEVDVLFGYTKDEIEYNYSISRK